MRILLTGRNGQLGEALVDRVERFGELTATARADLDLENGEAIRDVVRGVRPDLIINAAAYTAVDLAERERETAYRVNATAPGILAAEAAAVGAGLLHFSTDYVFDGRVRAGYREGDATGPLNVYGLTKLAGEQSVRDTGVAHAIIRVGWLYGGRYGNFLSTMTRLLSERDEVSVVDDQIGCPTWTGAVADATRELIERMLGSGERPASFLAAQGGTFHMAGPDSTSWFGFARAIAAILSEHGQHTAWVLPIPTSEYPRPAARPACSILRSDRLRERFGIELPSWEVQLSSCCESRYGLATAA